MNKHGYLHFSWDKNVLIINVEDPFNEEGFQYHTALIRNAVVNRIPRQWKRLEVWGDEVLGSPAVVKMCSLQYDWYEDNGCYLSAVVVSNSIQAMVLESYVKSTAKIFYDTDEALHWLNNE